MGKARLGQAPAIWGIARDWRKGHGNTETETVCCSTKFKYDVSAVEF